MQWTGPMQTRSGLAVLFDPSAVSLSGPAGAETLEAGAADGTILSWPALGEEIVVTVIVDEELPARLAAVAEPAPSAILRLPSGTAWLTDPAHLDDVDDLADAAPGSAQPLSVRPGTYRATARLLRWPPGDPDGELRRDAGRGPVALRDALGLATFLLGVATVIGLPVYLIGRALGGGLSGVANGLGLAALVLLPLWMIVLAGWRLPWVRRADRADRAIADRFPDVAVHLVRVGET